MRLELSRSAEVDLEATAIYSLETFGAAVAKAYLLSFREAFALLSAHPRVGRLISEIRPPIHCLSNRSHRILYDVEGDRVIVQRIVHKAMDVAARLADSPRQ